MKVVISWPTFDAICRSWNYSFFSSCLPFQCTSLAMRKKQGAGGKILKKWAAVLNMPFAAETPRSARWHRTTAPLIRSRRGPLPCLSSEFCMCHIRLPLLLRHRGLTGAPPPPPLSFSTHPRVPLRILWMLLSLSCSWQVHCGQWDLFLWPAGCQERQPISNQSSMSCWNKEPAPPPPPLLFYGGTVWRVLHV